MTFIPKFPTQLHQETGEIIRDGKAVPESDLDFAILIKPGTSEDERAQ